MTMSLNFNKVWASDTTPDYPTDTQAKRGLSFLGTEAPTFDLHDAIFQRMDNKGLWLYEQVRIACERFGQKVQNDDGSLVSDARDIMANAITYALLNQRKADEGGHGIVRMANADQTNAGNDYNLAVSPRHLAEYVSAQNTWANTKDKPQTALRWPNYDEVAGRPVFGDAAWKGFFDTGDASTIPYGYSMATSTGALATVRDAAYARDEALSKSINEKFSSLGNGSAASVFDADYGITWTYLPFEGKKVVVSTGALRNILEKLDNDIFSRLGTSAFVDIFDTGDAASIPYGSAKTASTGSVAATRDESNSKISALKEDVDTRFSKLGSAAFTNVIDETDPSKVGWGADKVISAGTFSSLVDKLGAAAYKGIYDTGDASTIPYGDGLLATAGSVAATRDSADNRANNLQDQIGGVGRINSQGESGWMKLPSGTILQYAVGDWQGAGLHSTVSFPISFPSDCYSCTVSTQCNVTGDAGDAWFQMKSWSTTGCDVYGQATGSARDNIRPIVWAIGY